MNTNNKKNNLISINNVISFLLYTFFWAIGINPLISYYFKINELHILIIIFMLLLLMLSLLKKKKIKINIICLFLFMYFFSIILSLSNIDFNIIFILKILSYRFLFPIFFLLLFLVIDSRKRIDLIGYKVIKLINILCIIMGLFALIEKNNPEIIYKFYGENLTPHLTLLINGKRTSRLISLIGNPINLGFYMGIGISSAITLIIINLKKSKIIILFEVLCIILFSYVMFFTYSRSAILTTVVICITLFILYSKNSSIKNKFIILFFASFICLFLLNIIFNVESINSRFNSISLEHYFKNTRFIRAYTAFNQGTSFMELIFGHGISTNNNSSAYVFELGYASLLYESGILGFITVILSYLKGILSGIKFNKNNLKDKFTYVNYFYIAIIISGLAGMFVEDLYMQQPYNIFLWFSTIFLVVREQDCKNYS